MTIMRRCSTCDIQKPLSDYGRKKEGHLNQCKECIKIGRKLRAKKVFNETEIIKDLKVKLCSHCHQTREAILFSRSKYSKDGLRNICKSCARESSKRSRDKTSKKNLGKIIDQGYKTCSRCFEFKPKTLFPRCAAEKDGLAYMCKSCNNKRKKEHNQKLRKYLDDRRSADGCKKCGLKDPDCLTNNHINPEIKNYNISNLQSIEAIEKEWVIKYIS